MQGVVFDSKIDPQTMSVFLHVPFARKQQVNEIVQGSLVFGYTPTDPESDALRAAYF